MTARSPEHAHKAAHLVRKDGLFHYRRRIPGHARGEIMLSLRTADWREAEHVSGLLDRAFEGARIALTNTTDEGRLKEALREALRTTLQDDLRRRAGRKPGAPVHATYWRAEYANEWNNAPRTANEADLEEIQQCIKQLRWNLERHFADGLIEAELDALAVRHNLPDTLRGTLFIGYHEAMLSAWTTIEKRSLGTAPLVFDPDEIEIPRSPPDARSLAPPVSNKPHASTIIEPFFTRRQNVDGTSHQVMSQERGTLRRFLEAAGDHPIDAYSRGDVTHFLSLLGQLPKSYGKSPRDKDRSLAEIIAEANATDAPRVTDKTKKRHLSTLSQFFQLGLDQGHLTVSEKNQLVEGHRFKGDAAARDQRDSWTSAELTALFSSPVWSGSAGAAPELRSKPGNVIMRDAKFWLPILALYHGARLEEFADLYRRDIKKQDGIWYFNITEEGGRRLKTANATRRVPLHPELLRLGFLDYVTTIAPGIDDPLFPDLKPQGKDMRRGPRITRWFSTYRRAIGVYRPGVGIHAFRHTVRTRFGDAITDNQQERNVDFGLGHARQGSEGRERYDKGPGLKALAQTMALLSYPEVDLRHLYTGAGDA